MANVFTIVLPESTSAAQLDEIKSAVSGVQDVTSAGVTKSRAMDAASIMMWVKLAGEIATAAGPAILVIQKTVELIRGKGIKGAKINLPSGATIQVDDASVKDIERLLRAASDKK